MDLFKYAQGQKLPLQTLYVVATPIGNLADITIRALFTLQQVDGIACEDKRHSSQLLSAYQISKPLLAVHEHNEAELSQTIVQKLSEGERWAYISDAGTPGISDPGSRLCEAVIHAGFSVSPLPGPSALISAASVAGPLLNRSAGQFQFIGFLPNKGAERQLALEEFQEQEITSFFYEAPHRLEKTLKDLMLCLNPERLIFIGKELSKLHENISICTVSALETWLAQQDKLVGEFVIGIGPSMKKKVSEGLDSQTLKWLDALAPLLSHKDLSQITSKVTGVHKNTVYELLLDKKNGL